MTIKSLRRLKWHFILLNGVVIAFVDVKCTTISVNACIALTVLDLL
ncbi:hypothetical protein [Ehrlichia minasensis]|nr:hypothetical protein [Ehrlichia minasensis]